MNVTIRPLRTADLPLLVQWRQQPDVAAWCYSRPTVESFARRIEAAGDSRQDFIVEIDGAPVGSVNLDEINRSHKRAECGVLIGSTWARRGGVATAATGLLLRHAFGPLELERVYLHVFASNAAAIRMYHRLGFRHEGVLRRHALKGGWLDVHVMGVLRSEWPLVCFAPSRGLETSGRRHGPHGCNTETWRAADVTCLVCKGIMLNDGGACE